MSAKPWPEDRRKELERLIRLVNECQSINSSNNVTARLERIIMLSQQVAETDYHVPRCSLMQFLIDKATGEGEA